MLRGEIQAIPRTMSRLDGKSSAVSRDHGWPSIRFFSFCVLGIRTKRKMYNPNVLSRAWLGHLVSVCMSTNGKVQYAFKNIKPCKTLKLIYLGKKKNFARVRPPFRWEFIGGQRLSVQKLSSKLVRETRAIASQNEYLPKVRSTRTERRAAYTRTRLFIFV